VHGSRLKEMDTNHDMKPFLLDNGSFALLNAVRYDQQLMKCTYLKRLTLPEINLAIRSLYFTSVPQWLVVAVALENAPGHCPGQCWFDYSPASRHLFGKEKIIQIYIK
jgi:hypothetical protein